MSISRAVNFNSLPMISSKTLNRTSSPNLVILKLLKDQSLFWALQSLQRVNYKNSITRNDYNNGRKFIAYSRVDPSPPPPSPPPPNCLNQILGFMVTVVLPFFSHKWMSLLRIKNEVEHTVETIEHVVDEVEKVAEEVEKVAEKIAHDLPEGGKLRNAVDLVENVAEKVERDAHQVEDFINKIQETEEEIETFVESLAAEAKEAPEETKEETLSSKPH